MKAHLAIDGSCSSHRGGIEGRRRQISSQWSPVVRGRRSRQAAVRQAALWERLGLCSLTEPRPG
jgi:hypothetical protein